MPPLHILAAVILLCAACQAPSETLAASAEAADGRSAGPSAQAPPTVELPDALARVLRDYEAAWRAEDEDRLAALFTANGWVLSNGRPPAHGRDAIRKRYADSGGPLHLRAFAHGVDGDTAWILGGFSYAPGEPDAGKFTLVLRRGADGRWRIVSDMDNGNSWPS